jgi:cytochrome bd-type quinol oxidase subunit 2
MNVHFLAKSRMGKWSLYLIVTTIVFFIILSLLAASGQQGGDTFLDNLALAIPGLIMIVSGIAAFFTGIISIIRSRERGILVFIATLLGLFVIIFIAGESIFTD